MCARLRLRGLSLLFVLGLSLSACSNAPETEEADAGVGSVDGQLLTADAVPGMRLFNAAEVATDPMRSLELEPLIYNDFDEAAEEFRKAGFKRVMFEKFAGAGTRAAPSVHEFGSNESARAAQEYIFKELQEPCPGTEQCSDQTLFDLDGIPGAQGQKITPFAPPEEPRFTEYNILFPVGTLVYSLTMGADVDAADPGSVTQAQAVAAAKKLYDRAKDRPVGEVFAPAGVFPAPADPLALAAAAGLTPATDEGDEFRKEVQLFMFIDGEPQTIPAGIGLNIYDPSIFKASVGGARAYFLEHACEAPCISPVHTHDATGLVVVESAAALEATLGQFFQEWGVKLDASCVQDKCEPDTPVAVYVNGKEVEGDPQAIKLEDRQVIAIVVGKAPEEIPGAPE